MLRFGRCSDGDVDRHGVGWQQARAVGKQKSRQDLKANLNGGNKSTQTFTILCSMRTGDVPHVRMTGVTATLFFFKLYFETDFHNGC